MALSKGSKGWWFAWLVLATSMATAKDRCAEETRWPETELCKIPQLARLDRQLNGIYRQAHGVVADKDALRQEQRQWLHSVRDACPDRSCLIKAYQWRVAALGERFVDSAQITDQPLSNAGARQACEAIAGLAENGSLESLAIPGLETYRDEPPLELARMALSPSEMAVIDKQNLIPNQVYLLRLGPGLQPERFVNLLGSGTCHIQSTANLKRALKNEETFEPVHDPDELLRWIDWSSADYPIVHDKRVFLVTAGVHDGNAVELLSWIKPNGRIRPLCMLKPQSTRLTVAAATQPELCASIAKGKLQPLAWRDETKQLSMSYQRSGGSFDYIGVLELDLDGNGRAEKIGRFKYASSAGCGGDFTWLSLLSDDLKTEGSGPLKKQLDLLSQGSQEIYSSGGRHYIAANDILGRPRLFSLQNGQVEQVCEFNRLTHRTVSTFFDVSP